MTCYNTVTGLNIARRWTLTVSSAGRLSAYRQTQIIAERNNLIAELSAKLFPQPAAEFALAA